MNRPRNNPAHMLFIFANADGLLIPGTSLPQTILVGGRSEIVIAELLSIWCEDNKVTSGADAYMMTQSELGMTLS
jgi:hypothetical protein